MLSASMKSKGKPKETTAALLKAMIITPKIFQTTAGNISHALRVRCLARPIMWLNPTRSCWKMPLRRARCKQESGSFGSLPWRCAAALQYLHGHNTVLVMQTTTVSYCVRPEAYRLHLPLSKLHN
jgi:hypothetical protein